MAGTRADTVRIPAGALRLEGDLTIPPRARGLVVFAHGSGSSRLSPRNRMVAASLNADRFATLLFDLLTEEEDEVYANRFDIPLLAERLKIATAWVRGEVALPLGYFGASTGAAAALIAAAELGDSVRAVVSRGGRADMAGEVLERVTAPVLLIVGGFDLEVIRLNRDAFVRLPGEKAMHVVPNATHLFEEPGALEEVAQVAGAWFERWLPEG